MDLSWRANKTLLVEDHHLMRQAVAVMLARLPGFGEIFQADSMEKARGYLGGVDLAMVDLGLPDGDGVELIGELLEDSPGCAVLVVTATMERPHIAQAVEAGAAGLVHKTSPLQEIVEALLRLRDGETLMTTGQIIEWMGLAERARELDATADRLAERLTPREKEVLAALGDGLDNRGISRRLGVALDTERNYMASLMTKLGARTRLQALVIAIRHGLVDLDAKEG